MRQYIAKRLLLAIPTFLLVSFLIFTLMRLVPGDAALIRLAGGADAIVNLEIYDAVRAELGLDKPYPIQYLDWLSGMLLRGDFGVSFYSRRPVFHEILERLPVSIELVMGSALISLVVAIPAGLISATRQDTLADYGSRLVAIAGLSFPGFWIGTILLVFPAIWLGYLPPLGYVKPWVNPWDNLRQFILPCLAIGAAYSATAMRMTRSQMLEVLRQDYIRTAWAKGLRERSIILHHALKNALIPVLTIAALNFGYLFGRTVVIETVFGLPGLGASTVQAVFNRDYPQIQGNVLFFGLIFIVVNLLTDVAYAWVDPRIRYQ